jgi:hypothetical protein
MEERAVMEYRADRRAAMVAATIANVHRGAGQRAATIDDLVKRPAHLPPEEEGQFMSLEEGEAAMDRWAKAQNARAARGEQANVRPTPAKAPDAATGDGGTGRS